jgi:hypothetical protein
MQDSVRRYFQICIGVLGALFSIGFIVSCLRGGTAPSLGRASAIAGVAYQRAAQPSQFWLILFLVGLACVGFVWLAWHAYRG